MCSIAEAFIVMDRASGCFATTPIFGQVRLMASRFGSCKAQNKKLAITNININYCPMMIGDQIWPQNINAE